MLVLSRTIGEIISIGDDIALHILELNGTHVKIGVEAPVGVNVHRAEVYQKILERQGAGIHPVPVPNL
ncbi:carbon storage regulator CsrA [Pseudomonas sp. MWU15-20650]|uniref:carbon storage regulator CsrA n=1 Tax=Pseudomonas sp. MWU15-20650 TaxID=2933107 RepID=UPI00200CA4A8|nr:carbon storage regulator CsrA [Pseudomonas sp. MWU15-20650]